MVEELLLDPVDPTHTEVRWRIHYTPTAWARPLRPVVEPVFRRWFQAMLDRLAGHLQATAADPQS